MGSCKWLLAGRVSGWSHGRGIGGWPRKGDWGGEGGGGVGNTMGGHSECFSVLSVHPNAVVCNIYVVKLLFGDTLPQRIFENYSRTKNVGLRIDKLLPKIGSSPYLVKTLHTQF